MTSADLDRRLHAYRDGLIDSRLRAHFPDQPASAFVEGYDRSLSVARAYIRKAPDARAPIETEIFLGNGVRCFSEEDGWTWLQSELDGYVGYVPSCALGEVLSANAIVSVPLCLCYREARATASSFLRLPMSSRLCIDADFSANGFLRASIGEETAYVSEHQVILLSSVSGRETDFVSTASSFMDSPYLYGGGCYAGMDCSALLQVSLCLHGISCPRDADMQESSLGDSLGDSLGISLDVSDGLSVDRLTNNLRRGDFIFWHRHVGIMLDGEHFLHANAHHMCVADERLSTARARIMSIEGEIRTVRRLPRIV